MCGDHEAQVLNYLKTSRRWCGFVIRTSAIKAEKHLKLSV